MRIPNQGRSIGRRRLFQVRGANGASDTARAYRRDYRRAAGRRR